MAMRFSVSVLEGTNEGKPHPFSEPNELKSLYQGKIRRESEAQTGWFLPFTRIQGFTPVYEETPKFHGSENQSGAQS
jgi:hypothetical protein